MATKTVINISPKVLTGTLTGLGLAAVGGIAAAVTPDTFGFLGVWAPGAFGVATILLGQAAAWLKKEEQAAENPAAIVTQTLPTPTQPAVPAPLIPQSFDHLVNPDAAAHADATAPGAAA